jgi:hypothetical protein
MGYLNTAAAPVCFHTQPAEQFESPVRQRHQRTLNAFSCSNPTAVLDESSHPQLAESFDTSLSYGADCIPCSNGPSLAVPPQKLTSRFFLWPNGNMDRDSTSS